MRIGRKTQMEIFLKTRANLIEFPIENFVLLQIPSRHKINKIWILFAFENIYFSFCKNRFVSNDLFVAY